MQSMRWCDVERFLREEAEHDLLTTEGVQPCMVTFRDDVPLFAAYVRPCEKPALPDALIELFAVACPLGANRVALSNTGRAWSLDDPVPPVVEGMGDLRQRVVIVHVADAASEPVVRLAVHPFDLAGGCFRWGDVVTHAPAPGWISDMLRIFVVDGPRKLRASRREIVRQLNRCGRLGHVVALAPPAAERLRIAA